MPRGRVGELQRENERLRQRLVQAETIIEVQKKVSLLLGSDPGPASRSDKPGWMRQRPWGRTSGWCRLPQPGGGARHLLSPACPDPRVRHRGTGPPAAAQAHRHGAPGRPGPPALGALVDASPYTLHATLLEEGQYPCSVRTRYRILAAEDQLRERRRLRQHPHYAKPELLATGPNQL